MYQDDIVYLASELERIRQTSVDLVTSTRSIKAVVARDSKAAWAGKHVELQIEGYGTYEITKHGSAQLTEKCGIPFKYYTAMLEAGLVDLTAENVNAWLSKQTDKRLVRIADNRIRALLSDRYRVLDNYDLAMLTMDRAKRHDAEVEECSLTETHLYVKLIVPGYREAVKAEDYVIPGLVISNSEVGAGAFRVEPFLLRLICDNGLIGSASLYKVHVGERLELGELVFKDETRQKMDEALWAQVRDIIDSTFNPNVLKAFVKKLRDATQIPIEATKEVVETTARNLSLSEEKKLELFKYFAKEGDTLFGLVNGITRLAQNFDDYDSKVSVERYAGELLEAEVLQ